ncbi:hypothetical protein Tco_0031355 [Tanacetum coccineum]
MLATRTSKKLTTMEAQANKTKSIRCLEHTLLSQATRKPMLETYHFVTSASITTLARVRQSVASASGWVTKQEIVGSQFRKQNQGPQWQNRKLRLLVISVEIWDITGRNDVVRGSVRKGRRAGRREGDWGCGGGTDIRFGCVSRREEKGGRGKNILVRVGDGGGLVGVSVGGVFGVGGRFEVVGWLGRCLFVGRCAIGPLVVVYLSWAGWGYFGGNRWGWGRLWAVLGGGGRVSVPSDRFICVSWMTLPTRDLLLGIFWGFLGYLGREEVQDWCEGRFLGFGDVGGGRGVTSGGYLVGVVVRRRFSGCYCAVAVFYWAGGLVGAVVMVVFAQVFCALSLVSSDIHQILWILGERDALGYVRGSGGPTAAGYTSLRDIVVFGVDFVGSSFCSMKLSDEVLKQSINEEKSPWSVEGCISGGIGS